MSNTTHHVEDSGTESGEDLKLIAVGLRDSMQMRSIKNQSDSDLISDVTMALNRLEQSLKEGKDLKLEPKKKNALLSLVARLQTGLVEPDDIAGSTVANNEDPSSPEIEGRRGPRLGHQRFAKRRNRANRHTVGVSKEELADARRYIEEMVMMESMSNCTTPESSAITPPEFNFPIEKSKSEVSSKERSSESSNLYRPNQFVPSHLKDSAAKTDEISRQLQECQDKVPYIQMREKKPKYNPTRQSANLEHSASAIQISENRRPVSDSYSHEYGKHLIENQLNNENYENPKYSSQINGDQEHKVQEKNLYNKTHHSPQEQNLQYQNQESTSTFNGLRPSAYNADAAQNSLENKMNRFSNKKLLMKRANTIDIPKPMKYINDMESDSEMEERGISSTKTIGLRGTVQVSVKNTPRQVVPLFQPKTENDHKFLAFIQKQAPSHGLGWNNPNKTQSSVTNWSSKFGNIKNSFESGAIATSNKPPVPSSSARNFWKKTEMNSAQQRSFPFNTPNYNDKVVKPPWADKNYNEVSTSVMKPIQDNIVEYAPKPVPVNKFSHAPMSAFKPIESSPPPQSHFKPIQNFNQVDAGYLTQMPASPTKMAFLNKSSQGNSPVPAVPWASQTKSDRRVLNIAANRFENKPSGIFLQRHRSFKEQDSVYPQRVEQKRPSLPNAHEFNVGQHCNNYQKPISYPSTIQKGSEPIADFPPLPYTCTDYTQPQCISTYVPETPPSLIRQDSLTNPEAEPLVLTSNRPIISPNIATKQTVKPFDFPSSPESATPNYTYNDLTDDESDNVSMTEYKVESKVMKGPVSQQAVTVNKRTNRVDDNEDYGRNSKAAQNLLSVMKNIGSSKSPERKPQNQNKKSTADSCMSPDGTTYRAPCVEPVFPTLNPAETNRMPLYAGRKSGGYQQPNPTSYTSYQSQTPATHGRINYQRKTPESPQYQNSYYQQNPAYITPENQVRQVVNVEKTQFKPTSYEYQQKPKNDSTSYEPIYNNIKQREISPGLNQIQMTARDQAYKSSGSHAIYQQQYQGEPTIYPVQNQNQQIKQTIDSTQHNEKPQGQVQTNYQDKKYKKEIQSNTVQNKQYSKTSNDDNQKKVVAQQPKDNQQFSKKVSESQIIKQTKEQTAEVVKQSQTIAASVKATSTTKTSTSTTKTSTFNMPSYQKNLTSTDPQVYKSSQPSDTPDIVKSSLPKEDFPILKKFGPARPHLYQPNAYQYPLTKSETTAQIKPSTPSSPAARKFSEPNVITKFVTPQIVETPSSPLAVAKDEIPSNIVGKNIAQFSVMSRRSIDIPVGSFGAARYPGTPVRPSPLSKSDSWHQIIQQQNATKPPSPKGFAHMEGNQLRRVKSGHSLAIPKMYEAGMDKSEVIEKQKTVAAYFSGQKSPNSLSRNSSQTNIAESVEINKTISSTKKSSINRIKTSGKVSISNQNPSTGLARSQTMPHMLGLNLLDESNVDDAFEQLLNVS